MELTTRQQTWRECTQCRVVFAERGDDPRFAELCDDCVETYAADMPPETVNCRCWTVPMRGPETGTTEIPERPFLKPSTDRLFDDARRYLESEIARVMRVPRNRLRS